MIDQSFGDFGQLLRAPDLRLGDVRTELVRMPPPFDRRVAMPDRGVCVFARRGNFILEVEGSDRPPIAIEQGTAVGFESGRAHRWRADSAKAAGLSEGESIELMISSIPRQMGVLQSLDEGLIIIPPSAGPIATLFRHTIEVHLCEFENPSLDEDDFIIRRCAEICSMQFVRYARAKMAEQPSLPVGLAHDEYLLRAWSAYFADPRRRWTVKALAKAAGLGRTAFAIRFREVLGAPPLQTLTTLRLTQAETMLRHSHAPLIEIAFTVGYNSEAAFVRAFSRQYGIPPGRYRSEFKAAGGDAANRDR